jgi:hypothetical protein
LPSNTLLSAVVVVAGGATAAVVVLVDSKQPLVMPFPPV